MSRYGRKLDENEVRAIRFRYSLGRDTCRTLGVRYRVCKSTIEWVLNGKTWKHVPIPDELAEKILEVKIRNSKTFAGENNATVN